jgi:hypothetical protein
MSTGTLGSLIVSGSHTVPVFIPVENPTAWTIFLGFMVFMMVEMGILSFSYHSVEQHYKMRGEVRQRNKLLTSLGLALIVFVAVSANVLDVVRNNIEIADSSPIWHGARVVIFLFVGISAPAMALITGEILAVDALEHKATYRKNYNQYTEDYQTWQKGLNDSWNRQKKKWGATVDLDNRTKRLTSETVSNSLSIQTDNRQTGLGYSRVSSAVDKAIAYLEDNPEAIELNVRDLGDAIGVGKDSAAKARKQFLSNGHS